MNQTCKVCGEPAAGFHFGAFTCEGCKSFFGRSFNNVSAISECKNNGECVINKKNRTACKACRLRKCLMVGMSKSGSRYGRRSNWFKIHCLLQEQQEKQQQYSDGMPTSPSASPYSFGMPPNGFIAKSHEEDFKTVSTPSTSPASSLVSDTPSQSLDMLAKFRAGAAPQSVFDHKHASTMGHHSSTSSTKLPKDPAYYMPPMTAFPGMPFHMPPTNFAQLFFSGFGGPGAAALSHHYQDMLMAKQSPFLAMDQMMLQKQMEEERHRAMINSPPVSLSPESPHRPLSREAEVLKHVTEPQQPDAEREEIDISGEPATKRQKRNPVCGNHEESANNNSGTVCKAGGDDQPLDLSLTKGNGSPTDSKSAVSAHLLSTTMSKAAGNSHRQKYKGSDCPAQTGEAIAATEDDNGGDEEEADDDVQVEVGDQKQTAFFDYFKQTFVRENQFLKIKNNEIYSF